MVSKDKLSFVAFWYGGLNDGNKLKKTTETLASIGYRAVEWKDTCFEGTEDMTSALKRSVAAAGEAGMSVPACVVLRDMTDAASGEKNIREVCAFIDACAEAGIGRINMASGGGGRRMRDYGGKWYMPSNAPDNGAAWDCARASFEKVASHAEKRGVVIALESVVGNLVHDYYTTRELLRMVDSPALCLTLDPSHYHLYGNDINWCVEQWGCEKIRHVHLKDAIGRFGMGNEPNMFPLLGEGGIDWSGFFASLDAIGYDGALSVEFESWRYMDEILHGDVDEAARLSYRSAAALIDNYLKK